MTRLEKGDPSQLKKQGDPLRSLIGLRAPARPLRDGSLMRAAVADDYMEPLRGRILRGEVPPPDAYVIEDRP